MVAKDHPRGSGKARYRFSESFSWRKEEEQDEKEENEKMKKSSLALERTLLDILSTHPSSFFSHSFFPSFQNRQHPPAAAASYGTLRARRPIPGPPDARRTHESKDRLQFSILNCGKVIKQREREREREKGTGAGGGGEGRKGEKEPAREARARDAASSEGGRRLARRPRVRWRQAAFSHSLTETRS